MSYGYMRPDPKEQFRHAIGFHTELIKIAMEMGFTKDQAIELVKIYNLASIASSLDGRY